MKDLRQLVRGLASRDVLYNEFSVFLPNVLFYRTRGGIVALKDFLVNDLDALMRVVVDFRYALFFNTYTVDGLDRTSYFMVDVDTTEKKVFDAVMDVLSSYGNVDKIPVYATRRGFHFYMKFPERVERNKVNAYFSKVFMNAGVKVDKKFDAPNMRVPFSYVSRGDKRRVVPFQGSIGDTLKAQYDLGGVERIYSDWDGAVFSKALVDEIKEWEFRVQVGSRHNGVVYGVLPPCLVMTVDKCRKERYLTHDQRVFFASLVKRILGEEQGRLLVHSLMSNCEDYSWHITEKRYRLVPDRFTYKCETIRMMGLCPYDSQRGCLFYRRLYRIW